jgi:hypothetical protein
LVASIALAVLGYVFFSQRQDEFGVLHAIGHSRRWLVRRTVGETVNVVVVVSTDLVVWMLSRLDPVVMIERR